MNAYTFLPLPDGRIQMSLIVPVYKEEANIRPFLARAEKVFESMGVRYEIILLLILHLTGRKRLFSKK